MKPSLHLRSFALGACVIFLSSAGTASAEPSSTRAALEVKTPPLTAPEARQIAEDAYIFGYPLITMEYTRRVMTNIEKPEGTKAPEGQLIRMRQYPTAAFKDVTAPNADTLYTTTFMDVSTEPKVLSLPDAHDRYYLMPMLDGWTNVFQVPGKRTTGTGPQKYLITGPKFKGKIPAGLTQYKAPTGIVWLLGRIYCTGTPEDYASVHKMQDEVTVVPLSAYGKAYTPPLGKVDPSIDMKTAVRDQVNNLTAEQYFTLLAKLMVDNPPAAADAPMLAKMSRLGITSGHEFTTSKLTADVAAAVNEAPATGFKKIMGHFRQAGSDENGWIFSTGTGIYGTDYLQRAFITAIGLGANRPQDAVYPTADIDVEGKPLEGSKDYVIHFEKGKLPPVNGFWSLTMYNSAYFFVDNPLNRYTISARDKLTESADGSVDIYISNKNPGGTKEANWLPAPADGFKLMLRLYWPKETPPSIIDRTWKIPGVKPAA